jgi:hypothetical protein
MTTLKSLCLHAVANGATLCEADGRRLPPDLARALSEMESCPTCPRRVLRADPAHHADCGKICHVCGRVASTTNELSRVFKALGEGRFPMASRRCCADGCLARLVGGEMIDAFGATASCAGGCGKQCAFVLEDGNWDPVPPRCFACRLSQIEG